MTDDAKASPPEAPRVSDQKAQIYIEQRLKPQLAYFEGQAKRSKIGYRAVSVVQITATVAIPVVNVFVHSVYTSSILAGVAALASGIAQLERYQERWLTSRQTAGVLEGLKLRHEIGLPPFDADDRNDRLIADAEAALGQESTQWKETAQQKAAPPSLPTILVGGG